jgi:hypothetical protein
MFALFSYFLFEALPNVSGTANETIHMVVAIREAVAIAAP